MSTAGFLKGGIHLGRKFIFHAFRVVHKVNTNMLSSHLKKMNLVTPYTSAFLEQKKVFAAVN